MSIKSYAEFQEYFTKIHTANISELTGDSQQADSALSPHGAFWSTLSYDSFVNGKVPGVDNPDTGEPLSIVEKGSSSTSNFILALQGAPGSLFDPATGSIGQMPADGPPFLTPEQIQPIADWIDAGCPE